jgi:hypothetical protein
VNAAAAVSQAMISSKPPVRSPTRRMTEVPSMTTKIESTNRPARIPEAS